MAQTPATQSQGRPGPEAAPVRDEEGRLVQAPPILFVGGTGRSGTHVLAKLVTTHLGDDAGRVATLVDVLLAAFGPGVTLTADDVRPYLGETGSVPSYLLTNAIESGDPATALDVVRVTTSIPSEPNAPSSSPEVEVCATTMLRSE